MSIKSAALSCVLRALPKYLFYRTTYCSAGLLATASHRSPILGETPAPGRRENEVRVQTRVPRRR